MLSFRPSFAALAFGAGLALAASLAPAARAAEVTVFAAASLKNAMDEIAAAWEAESGDVARVSLAGSSALARQIQQGAPAEVFISANTDWMDRLEADGLLAEGSRVDLLRNALVLVAHGEAEPVAISPQLDLAGMLGEGRLAMALVEALAFEDKFLDEEMLYGPVDAKLTTFATRFLFFSWALTGDGA